MSRIGSETQTNDVWRSPVELTERQAIPTEAAAQLGLQPGAPVEMETGASSLLRRPVKHLAKVYVELNKCGKLDCRTGSGNARPVRPGGMTGATVAAPRGKPGGLFGRSRTELRRMPMGAWGEPKARNPGCVGPSSSPRNTRL